MEYADNLCEAAFAAGKASGKASGFADGRQAGYLVGNHSGFSSGKKVGHVLGKEVGYVEGIRVGHNAGKKVGYILGEQTGYAKGEQDGCATGGFDALSAVPCLGLRHDTVAGLYGKASGGTVSLAHLFAVYQTSLASTGPTPAPTLAQLLIVDPIQYAVLERKALDHADSNL